MRGGPLFPLSQKPPACIWTHPPNTILKKRMLRNIRRFDFCTGSSPLPRPGSISLCQRSRGPTGGVKTTQRAAKSAARAAKTAPSAAQERFRPAQASASGAVWPAIWRPTAPPRAPPGGYFGSLGARFQTLRGPLGETSAAESAPFRGALAIAARPVHSTAPEVNKVTECQIHNPAKRPLANKRGRRDGRSHSH